MEHNTITLSGIVSSIPRTISINDGLSYASFRLHTRGTYQTASGKEVNYHEAHDIVAVGTLAKFALSIKIGAEIEVEGELRSRLRTVHPGDSKDVQITYRCWQIAAASIRPYMSYSAATQKENVSDVLMQIYKQEES